MPQGHPYSKLPDAWITFTPANPPTGVNGQGCKVAQNVGGAGLYDITLDRELADGSYYADCKIKVAGNVKPFAWSITETSNSVKLLQLSLNNVLTDPAGVTIAFFRLMN